MLLRTWMTDNEVTNARMAIDLGMTLGHISDLRRRRYWPSKTTTIKIIEYTRGQVTANDFLPDMTQRRINKNQ